VSDDLKKDSEHDDENERKMKRNSKKKEFLFSKKKSSFCRFVFFDPLPLNPTPSLDRFSHSVQRVAQTL